jgi:hypothetical protein
MRFYRLIRRPIIHIIQWVQSDEKRDMDSRARDAEGRNTSHVEHGSEMLKVRLSEERGRHLGLLRRFC